MGVRARIAAVAALALAGSVLVAGQADAGGNHSSLKPVATGLNGPRGVSTYGNKVIYSVSDGSVYATDGRRTWKLGTVPGSGGFPPAIDTNKWGVTYALTGAGGEPGQPPIAGGSTLYRLRPGKAPVKVKDIAAYQAHDPDPYNQADSPTESNPFGVAALRDGTVLVADAANNDLLRVWPNGYTKTVARLKPRTVKVPAGLGSEAPPAGTPFVQLARESWLKFESGGSTIGSLYLQYPGRHHKAGYKRELVRGQLNLPGGTAFNRWGQLFVSAPVFGTGAVYRVKY
jgi:hypothetical protein